MWRGDEKFPENGFEAWGGYMQAKIAKLEEQFSSRAEKEASKLSDIFSGISIYVNGYTTPSADELKTLMSEHGGVYHTYQKNEDYIIASNLPDTKVKKMSLARVVKAEWITDSIKANCLLDYRNYLLYRDSRTQPKLNFNITNEIRIKNDQSIEVKREFSKTTECNLNIETQSAKTEIDTKETKPILHTDIILTDFDVEESSSKSPTSSKVKGHQSNFQNEFKVAKTAVDSKFLSEFYNNSRLHHISQLGACFKQYVNDLRENSSFKFPAHEDLKQKILGLSNPNNLTQMNFEGNKTIMHIDMDCFFVSVGLRKRPDLVGKPVAVTHSKGGHTHTKRAGVDRNSEFNLYRQKQAKKICKAAGLPQETNIETRVDNIGDEDDKFGSMSEIASCSYEARAKGVHNGMFMGSALRLCPDLQTIAYDFEGYKEVAYTLYNTVAKYTLDIEAVSCDEMYVDCTELLKAMDLSVQDFATMLRDEIKTKTGCPCSTGFGGNRLQARLATKKAKPDGQFFLTAELVEDYMFDIKLKDLPGVGAQTSHKLESMGHTTCGSLQNLPLVTLQQHLGNKTGAQLFDQCRGHDFNSLNFHTVRKSVSAEVNYGIRFENFNQCEDFLKQLSAEVHSRMRQFKVLGKCITLKLMVRAEEAPVETAKFMGHGFCNVINKSTSLNNVTNDVEVITKEVITLYKKQKIDPKELRGVGIQVTKLESLTTCDQRKGAINKYFCIGKTEKVENKIETKHIPVVNTNRKIVSEFTLKSQPTTPKKINVCQSPRNKSPIVGSLKSPPAKRRGRPSKNVKPKHTSINLMNKFLQVPTKDTPYKDPMPKAHLTENEMKKTGDKPQGLLGFPWERIRELLRAWFESGQSPLQCDVDLITEYMCEMVISKNIDKLSILLRFFKRRTDELISKDWTEVYNRVVGNVQNAMIAVYGKRLCADV